VQFPVGLMPQDLDLAASSTRIRQYKECDLEAVFQIFDQPLCRRFLGREPFTTEAEIKAWLELMPPRAIRLVGTRAGHPVGIGVLVPEAGSRAHVGGLCVFVHDRFQRLGIGGALLRALIAAAERFHRLQRLELIVVCDNVNALKLYQKFGFGVEGRHANALRYGGQLHDTYMMARFAPLQ
jgi:L-phenylalanine/L-methionine N-acetyltransferase